MRKKEESHVTDGGERMTYPVEHLAAVVLSILRHCPCRRLGPSIGAWAVKGALIVVEGRGIFGGRATKLLFLSCPQLSSVSFSSMIAFTFALEFRAIVFPGRLVDEGSLR